MAPTAKDEARPDEPAADEDEDDYMNMVIEEPTKKETTLERIQREKRERIERSQNQKTKREREEEAEAAREAALDTAIDSSNKGFQMLAKMGFKQGDKLGKGEYGRAEPIRVEMKDGRQGIGLESEKKRKLREVYEEHSKKAKVEKETEEQFFNSVIQEQKNKRMEGQFFGAQKVIEKLDTEAEEESAEGDTEKKATSAKAHDKPLKSIPVVWRGLVRHRLEKESEGLMRKALETRSSRLPTYDDPDEDEDYKRGLGLDDKSQVLVDEDLTEEDAELDDFNALEPEQKLEKAVQYLRDKHNYCFWCKYRYPDDNMEGCPGITEEDHD